MQLSDLRQDDAVGWREAGKEKRMSTEREERLQTILEAAFAVFAEKGYHKATLSEIARTAGMRQGTLYYYYKTKDDLFWGVYDMMMSALTQQLDKKLIPDQTPQERLHVLLEQLLLNFPELGYAQNEPDVQKAAARFSGFSHVFTEFWLHAKRTNNQEQFYQKITSYQRKILAQITQLMEELGVQLPNQITPHEAAHLLLALRDGLSLQLRMGLVGRYGGLFEKMYQFIMQRMLQGLITTREEPPNE